MLSKADQPGQLYNLYLYKTHSQDLVRVIKDIEQWAVESMVENIRQTDDFIVKVVDQFDGVIVLTVT